MSTAVDDVRWAWDVRLLDWLVESLRAHGFAESIRVVHTTKLEDLKAHSGKYATVVRTYLPVYDLEDLNETRITIVPISLRHDWVTRGHNLDRYEIHLVIQKRLQVVDRDDDWVTGDTTSTLARQIQMFYECQPHVDLCDAWARWMPQGNRPSVFVIDETNSKHTWATVLQTFWGGMYSICPPPCV